MQNMKSWIAQKMVPRVGLNKKTVYMLRSLTKVEKMLPEIHKEKKKK